MKRLISLLMILLSLILFTCKSNISKNPQCETISAILFLEDNSFSIALSNHLWKKCEYLKKLENLNKVEFNLLLVDYLSMEVNNGGFHQFYANTSGNYAHETEQALKEIGAYKMLQILEQANSLFPGNQVPKDREKRLETLLVIDDSANPTWDSLNQKFYGSNPQTGELEIENVDILMRNYIKAHISQFD